MGKMETFKELKILTKATQLIIELGFEPTFSDSKAPDFGKPIKVALQEYGLSSLPLPPTYKNR